MKNILSTRQKIIYRELPINRKLEVKVFNYGEDTYDKFIDEFIAEKESYIAKMMWDSTSGIKEDEKEKELKMTPWETIDFLEVQKVELGGVNIGIAC